jgi:hypothetical protein
MPTMEQPAELEQERPPITVEGAEYAYLKERLMGGYIYANADRSAYLRTHNVAEIAGEVNLTRELGKRGFPVPKILGTGMLPSGESYYIEESIGEKVFGDVFMEETKAAGYVNDDSFDAFTQVAKRYAEAQFNPANLVPHDKEALAHMASLANIMRNNPPSDAMHPAFMEAYEKAAERMLTLPWGYVQADLNAFNMLPNGIIDFELAHFGPVGYDVFTNVYFGTMWPKERIAYRFTDEQIAQYVAELDAVAVTHNLPAMSAYSNDFMVLKTIWSTAKDKNSEANPDRHTEFWKWRVQVRDWAIEQYLKGEKVDANLFEKVGSHA